jgi:CBS domain-containing protein
MKVKDIMTRRVEIATPITSVKEAAGKMRDLNIGALPVCEHAKLIGMVTDRDITTRVTAQGKDPLRTMAKEIMTPNIEWCFDDDEIEEVAEKMEKGKIRRLPVIDRNKLLVGIVSVGDIAMWGNPGAAGKILEGVSVESSI